ncbi:hypothetical protein MMC16_004303 [Acarospora aff. strigata]|nr:hypothetical protein [Acarospora aff. strigata]
MSLNIKVINLRERKVFCAGDRISGIVVATGPIHDDNTVVELKFKGKSKTVNEAENMHSSSKQRFFTFTTTLLDGPCNIESGSVATWPFTFQLPLQTVSKPADAHEAGKPLSTSEPYAKGPSPLPPTFSASGHAKHASGFLIYYKVVISYELRADLRRSKTFSRTIRAKGSLPVVQFRTHAEADDPDPDPRMKTAGQDFTHTSSRLLPGHEVQSRSLREWTSDAFTSKAPSVHFRLSATSPSTLVEGQSIPLELRLAVDGAGTTAIGSPQFRLTKAAYEFKKYTHVRAGNRLNGANLTHSESVLSRCLSLQAAETILEDGETISLPAMREISLPQSMVPSFSSQHIGRSYTAKLNVELECAGKKFEARLRWTPVVLLPSQVDMPRTGEEEAADGLGKPQSLHTFGVGESVELGIAILHGVLEIVGALIN